MRICYKLKTLRSIKSVVVGVMFSLLCFSAYSQPIHPIEASKYQCLQDSQNLEQKLEHYLTISTYLNSDMDMFAHNALRTCSQAIANDVFQDPFSPAYEYKMHIVNAYAESNPQAICELDMDLRGRWEDRYLDSLYSATQSAYNTDQFLVELLQLRFFWTALTLTNLANSPQFIARVLRFFKMALAMNFGLTTTNYVAGNVARDFFHQNQVPIDPAFVLNCPLSASEEQDVLSMSLADLGEQIQQEMAVKLSVVGLNALVIAVNVSENANVARHLARIRWLQRTFVTVRGAMVTAGVATSSIGPQVVLALASIAIFYGTEAYVHRSRHQNHTRSLLQAQNELESLIDLTIREKGFIREPLANRASVFSISRDERDVGIYQRHDQIYMQAREVLENTYRLMGFYNQPLTESFLEFIDEGRLTQDDWSEFLASEEIRDIMESFPRCEIVGNDGETEDFHISLDRKKRLIYNQIIGSDDEFDGVIYEAMNQRWYEKTRAGDYCQDPNGLFFQMSQYFEYLYIRSQRTDTWNGYFALDFLNDISMRLRLDVNQGRSFWNQ